jgi:hypothetical protein
VVFGGRGFIRGRTTVIQWLRVVIWFYYTSCKFPVYKVIRQKVRNFRNNFIPSPILFFNINRAIDSNIKVLNREGDRLNYHTLPCETKLAHAP